MTTAFGSQQNVDGIVWLICDSAQLGRNAGIVGGSRSVHNADCERVHATMPDTQCPMPRPCH
ncbi:hypothetical protein J6590_048038 [Homalodisca vitripennis]|nr:hypothetical protein J6590_048038 [Homalodisca vitripennis]